MKSQKLPRKSEVDLDAHDLVHVGVELAQGLADAIERDAHFLLEADGLVVRWNRHAHLTRDEDPAAGFGIDTQRLTEALRDRAGEMSHWAQDGTLPCMSGLDGGGASCESRARARCPAIAAPDATTPTSLSCFLFGRRGREAGSDF